MGSLGRALLIMILLVTALPLLSLTPSASAASFVVNQAGDAGDGTCDVTCTLRDAIDDANDTEEADIITFSGVTTITLTDGTLYVDEDVTIQGTGSASLTIQDSSGCYSYSFYLSDESSVSLSGFTLVNTNCTYYGIYVTDSAATINDVVVRDFYNDGIYSGNGGGDFATTLTVSNSVVESNEDSGIRSYNDTVTISNTTVRDNGYDGIYSCGGDVTVTGSLIEENGYDDGDDGIDVGCDNGSLTVSNTIVRGNSYDGIQGCNGAIAVTDSLIEDNGDQGIDMDCGGGTLIVRGTTVQGNGVDNGDSDAGGIEAYGVVLIVDSTIANNTGGYGAGLALFGAVATINSTTITGNVADQVGGGILNVSSVLQVYNSTISGNSAGQFGGGIIQAEGGTLQLSNSTVSANTTNGIGGGIFVDTSSETTVTLRFATVAANTAGIDGGGIAGLSLGNFGGPGISAADAVVAAQEGVSINLLGSIVAGNVDNETTGQTKADCFGGPFVSLGYNLVGVGSDCPTSGTGDIAFNGAITSVLNTTLADNGGNTPTHALTVNSPAKAQVPAALCASSDGANGRDQRGFARPTATNCDIGAFEADPPQDCTSPFTDVSNSDVACTAIVTLSNEGIIRGYATNPPTFGPDDDVQRAQMAAFIVRAFDWQNRPTGPKTFTDFGQLNQELRNASLILANACEGQNCVVRGYEADDCEDKGKDAPCFGPNDDVTYAQVITFISRAFDFDGSWTAQPNGPLPNTGVPAVHQTDVRTYNFYAGAIPEAPTTSAGWNAPASREWVARVLYQALVATP